MDRHRSFISPIAYSIILALLSIFFLSFSAMLLGQNRRNGIDPKLLAKAMSGDPVAERMVGDAYQASDGVEQDLGTAISWYEKAADQSDSDAAFKLGVHFQAGLGVPRDTTKSMKWLLLAASLGNIDAEGFLGDIFYEAQQYTDAADWYRKAAEGGATDAQEVLALMYENGTGVSQDYAEAAILLKQAANANNKKAQFLLALQYDKGQGVPQDYAEAITWYRKAALQGVAEAQRNLGEMYARGMGLQQNYAESYFWLDIAVAGLDEDQRDEALRDRNAVAQHLSADQLAKEQARAVQWFSDHSPAAHPQSNEKAQ